MQDLNPVDNYLHGSWEALGNAAPMLVALAQLASDSWVKRSQSPEMDDLSGAAKAILFAARERGIVEIKAVNSAFDAASRILAVYVEMDDERTIAFRDPADPAVTIEFLEGFRELCACGLMLHHIHRDFSLSTAGLEIARQVNQEDVQELLDRASEFGIHD